MTKIKAIILISGTGSNAKALLEAGKNENYPISFVAMVADKECAGLKYATDSGIPYQVFDYKALGKEKFEEKLQKYLIFQSCDIILLAGFMRILSENFINSFKNRILNIHPSLLPDFKGLNTHKRAIERAAERSAKRAAKRTEKAGNNQHGCSVHLVSKELDSGKVLGQSKLNILKDDTAESLAKKVLKLEHKLYHNVAASYAQFLLKENRKGK